MERNVCKNAVQVWEPVIFNLIPDFHYNSSVLLPLVLGVQDIWAWPIPTVTVFHVVLSITRLGLGNGLPSLSRTFRAETSATLEGLKIAGG